MFMQIYLKFSYRNTLLNLPVKKCLMIFRTESLMNDVHDLVRQNLPGFTDPSTRPYVMNHGGLGPITQQNIIDRKDEINLFLSTRYISGIKLFFFSFTFQLAHFGLLPWSTLLGHCIAFKTNLNLWIPSVSPKKMKNESTKNRRELKK